jgi:PAS domain S-box-containing protein
MNAKPTYSDLEQKIRVLEETIEKAKQDKRVIQESREKFRTLVDSTPLAVLLYQDDRWISANRAAETISGYSIKELLLQNVWDFVCPDCRPFVMERVRKFQSGKEEGTRYELKIITKNGLEKWVDVTSAAAIIDGRPAGVISAIDITEHKRADMMLQHERDLLQKIMNSTRKAQLVYLDRDFNFVRVNESYAAGCGYRPEELIGQNHFVLYPNAENEAIFRHVRDTGESFEVCDKPFEFPDQPERGVTYWDWTLRPIKNTDGQISGLVFSLYETTERKKNKDRADQLVLELQEALAKVKTLRGFLPICSSCKKIRDDKGYWEQVETYIRDHSEAQFSHGICPECAKKLYPLFYEEE